MMTEDTEIDITLTLPKRKKKKHKLPEVGVVTPTPTYTYMELLERVYKSMLENGQVVDKVRPTRLSIPPPQLSRAGRKVIWCNFGQMCQKLGRPLDHVQKYLDHELCTRSTLKANNAMAMKLRILPNQLMDLLYKYCKQFIICSMCKSIDTVLEKDPVTRIMFLKCHSCLSKRSTSTFF